MKMYRKILIKAGCVLWMGSLPSVAAYAAAGQTQSQLSGPAEATQAQPEQGKRTETAGTEKDHTEQDKRVCKRMTVTGSRFAKVVCHTQAQWRDMAQGTRSKMREIDSMPVSVNSQTDGSGDATGP